MTGKSTIRNFCLPFFCNTGLRGTNQFPGKCPRKLPLEQSLDMPTRFPLLQRGNSTTTKLCEKLLAGLYEVALPPLAIEPAAAPVTRSRSRASRVEES